MARSKIGKSTSRKDPERFSAHHSGSLAQRIWDALQSGQNCAHNEGQGNQRMGNRNQNRVGSACPGWLIEVNQKAQAENHRTGPKEA